MTTDYGVENFKNFNIDRLLLHETMIGKSIFRFVVHEYEGRNAVYKNI